MIYTRTIDRIPQMEDALYELQKDVSKLQRENVALKERVATLEARQIVSPRYAIGSEE